MRLIKGAFETSDWPTIIDRVQLESGMKNAVAKCWDFEKLHDITEQQVNERIESKELDKNVGILVQGQLLAYDIFTPTVEKIEELPFEYNDYDEKYCKLVELDEHNKRTKKIIEGTVETCTDWGKYKITSYIQDRYKTLYVIGKNEKFKIFNTESHAINTQQVVEKRQQLVLPVHRYNWAVNM